MFVLNERFPRNENARVRTPEPRENIERPTSNTERRSEGGFALPFGVRRWMFGVGCSSGFMGRQGEGCRSGFMVPMRFQILEVPPLHEPPPRSVVSAERRWLLFPRIAALCRDAAMPGFMVPMCGWKTVGTTHDQVAADVSPRTLKYSGRTHVGSRVRPPHPFQPV